MTHKFQHTTSNVLYRPTILPTDYPTVLWSFFYTDFCTAGYTVRYTGSALVRTSAPWSSSWFTPAQAAWRARPVPCA